MTWQNLEKFWPQFQSIFLIDWIPVGGVTNNAYLPLTCWIFSRGRRKESDTNESAIAVVL
jgi:hypothetical protein